MRAWGLGRVYLYTLYITSNPSLPAVWIMRYGELKRLAMKTLETLTFDNAALRDLPVDSVTQNVPRQGKYKFELMNRWL